MPVVNPMKFSGVINKPKTYSRKGSFVAMIGGIFVVCSEVLETLVPVQGELWGIAIAVIIILLLRPVQLLVLRMTGSVVKRADRRSGDVDQRKLEVYRAAVEGALEDGIVTDKERCILRRLRENLQLSEADVHSVERGFRSSL